MTGRGDYIDFCFSLRIAVRIDCDANLNVLNLRYYAGREFTLVVCGLSLSYGRLVLYCDDRDNRQNCREDAASDA